VSFPAIYRAPFDKQLKSRIVFLNYYFAVVFDDFLKIDFVDVCCCVPVRIIFADEFASP
jgi:hypothetical protein